MSLILKLCFPILAVNEPSWNIRAPRAARSSSLPSHIEMNQTCGQRGRPRDNVENGCERLFPAGWERHSLQGLGHGFP